MFRSLRITVASLAGAWVFAGSTTARADILPDGKKAVVYSFVVEGASVAPDRVLFAYPCGTSSGQPVDEYRKLEEGVPYQVGRRGGSCEIYAVPKTAYAQWIKEHPAGKVEDIGTLFTHAQKCAGAPSPVFFVSNFDLRRQIEETLEVTTLNDTSCVLTSKGRPSARSWFSYAAVAGLLAAAIALAIAAWRRRIARNRA